MFQFGNIREDESEWTVQALSFRGLMPKRTMDIQASPRLDEQMEKRATTLLDQSIYCFILK